ncbi:Negative regulator of mitotic exit [Mortierella sp. AD094]|nr:Negative regulator of mitotic exit [Mortierella sp. AD094]
MGLFSTKKKEDPATSNKEQNSNSTKQQRPPPSPNGLHGPNNSSNNMQGGIPINGGNNSFGPGSNGPLSPMSPISPSNNGGSMMQLQPAPYQSAYAGPTSPTQLQSSLNLMSSPSSASLLATPQLFWTQRRILGTNPFPRFQHTSSVTVNGTDIFLYGGSQRGTTKSDLFVIDSISLQCQAIDAAGADPPMAKSGHTAVNIGQYIIYFGGWNSITGQCDDSLHVLHTIRKEWNKPAIQGPLPTPRHSHTGCNVGTIMYIFGGQVDNFYLDDIAAFDMKTITQNPRWEKLEPQTESPPARSGHCAGTHDGKIYIFGGADADYFYNDIWCFDPRALTWTPIPASGYLPTGRHGHSCTVADGIMYIFGGFSPDGTELNDAYAFKIHERRWYLFQNVGPVASARSGHTMCTVKDRIFVLGGESEQTKLEDSALIHYLEISKIRFPDSGPSSIPPRQASSQKLASGREGSLTDVQSSGGSDSDRNSGQQRPPERPDRPDRPDRRLTQRPISPSSYERQGSSSSLISQQTSQLMNPQLGQRPLTTLGTPPPRGASAGFQNAGPANDYQAEGLTIATRRQTLRDDFQGGYGGAVIGTASPVSGLNVNRRTLNQMPASPTVAGPSPSPLRVINVSPSSPQSARPLPSEGDSSPTATRGPDRRTMNFVPPPPGPGSNSAGDVSPYAMEAITPSSVFASPTTQSPSSGGYVPPPPLGGSASLPSPSSPIAPVSSQSSPTTMRGNLPPPPVTSSPPTSGTLSGVDKKRGQTPPPPPHSMQASTPIPGPLDRSTSPAPVRFTPRGSGGSSFGLGIGPAPSSPIANPDSTARTSVQDMARIKSLESKAEAAQDENALLKQEMKEKLQELEKMKKRENWLIAEVILARDSLAPVKKDASESSSFQNKRLSMIDLERELENGELEGQHLKITKALIRVKEELRNAKMSIATQAQTASSKIKEAERIRTGALQEAAYLKAKLSSLTNAQQDPDALARVETERAVDLEKRLTSALNELGSLESKFAKAQEALEQERISRVSAEERSQGSSLLADQAQSAHTRALAELATLHARTTKAETESREYAAQLAEAQAGSTGHQSQSSGLLQKIKSLKEQVEEHEKALERIQMAYSAANDRAMRAEARSDEASQKIEKLESERYELSSEASRYKDEAGRLHSKVDELENRLQVSKDEVTTLRKLVEDGLGAFSPRAKAERGPERKHDSIAILSTVSKVSELEHELGSLKKLHSLSKESASRSATELAEARMQVSRLEQSSMQARAETISLQKMLSQEREGSSQLKNELSRIQLELDAKVKEHEDHEVQLGLLKDVMREKGIIAEDVVMQARDRGTPAYATSMEEKVRDAEERVYVLQMEIEESRSHYAQQLEKFEVQRHATIQHSEKSALLLRKLKDDLGATMKEKDEVEREFRQLQEEHARCDDHTQKQFSQKKQEEERVLMLTKHWDEERRDLTGQLSSLQSRLVESEMHSAELSQKVISITERLQEVENLNETIADELEALQDETKDFKSKAATQEEQLKADVERLVTEIHQVQEKLHAKQIELDEAFELNEQLGSQLDNALQAQAAAVTSQSDKSSVATQKVEEQRQDLERRLKKAQETIQVLESDNSVLEARLADSEKKVALLLENMHSIASNPNSPLNSANLAGVHQQLNSHLNNSGDDVSVSDSTHISSLNLNSHRSSPATNANRLLDNVKNGDNTISNRSSPTSGAASYLASNVYQSSKSAVASNNNYMQSYGQSEQQQQQQAQHEDDYSEDEYVYNQQPNHFYQQEHDSRRDSVDSITRELELLKVPWNKNTPAFKATTSYSSQPTAPQEQTQQQNAPGQSQLAYQYSGKYNDHQNQFYDYNDEDSSDGDNEEEYLAHLRQQHDQQGKPQQHSMDTHSFDDRSPSRLKEYEQMIDEIENTRLH